MSAKIFSYSFPTAIQYGIGARRLVVSELQNKGASAPLLVTDQALVELPMVKDFVADLKSSGLSCEVFGDIVGNPVKSQVKKGVEAFLAGNCDSVVAFGGGAAMDVAKVIALMAHHPGDLFDYEDGKPNGLPVDQKMPLILALPTTAGTGSEVGRSSVISDDVTKIKKIIYSPRLLPSMVFLDPDLTASLPPKMTAATGVDALTHLLEAYLAVGFHPMCEGIALEGIRLVAKALPVAFDTSKDVAKTKTPEAQEARGMMLNASMMGAVAFQKGLGVNHSCAHALSTVCDTHHGLANAVVLPECMKFNLETVPEKFLNLAKLLDLKPSPEAFIQWIEELQTRLEIPKNLKALGVAPENLDRLVEVAVADVCHQCNPRPVSQEDFVGLFSRSLEL